MENETTVEVSTSDRESILKARRSLVWSVAKVFLVGLAFVLVLPFLPGRTHPFSIPGTRGFIIIYAVAGTVLFLITFSLIRSCRQTVRTLNRDLREGVKNRVVVTITDDRSGGGFPAGFEAIALKTNDLKRMKESIRRGTPGNDLLLEYAPDSKMLLSLSEVPIEPEGVNP